MSGIQQALISGSAGGSSDSVTLNNATVSRVAPSGTATVIYRLGSDGTVYHNRTGSYVAQYAWTTGVPGNYEARVTVNSGALTSGTSGSWLVLSSNRDWTVSDTTANDGEVFAYLTVEIRDVATSTVRATASVNIIAEVSTL